MQLNTSLERSESSRGEVNEFAEDVDTSRRLFLSRTVWVLALAGLTVWCSSCPDGYSDKECSDYNRGRKQREEDEENWLI